MEPLLGEADEALLASFSEPVRVWFRRTFGAPTRAQRLGMGPIAARRSTLLLAPTGSGKTLAAFLSAIERVMFGPDTRGLKVVYVSPLKALAVDIERNLRAPIAGIAAVARELGVPYREPSVFVRSGDTRAKERAGFVRVGADVLITTPESLYLLLTSEPSRHFVTVETVIIDEIHVLAATKRGSHLWLSLERLEALRSASLPPLVRIGLTATVRPLEPVARVLAGYSEPGSPRPVEIVDAGTRRAVELKVEVPVEDLRTLSNKDKDTGPNEADADRSIWPSLYPRIVELIRAHTTTLVFVNNRRLAERLSAAINESAGEELALAHHGSIAHDRRVEIEARLKAGTIPAIIATSSLELGIDMGAIDLVVQIEAPPTVAAGLQRVGRAGHRASAVSKGVVFPKFRADLLACVATARAMEEGQVESTAIPENPLDVLAQQIVAIVSMGTIQAPALYDLVRRAAPYATLPQSAFDGVLDMLSGRYPSDEFAELRPRITWDRVSGKLTARIGAKRIAILSGGTIPDRGLFGVFLDTSGGRAIRIGELDEEMVFESRIGEVFLLGASSWRITDITHDRVLALPAPGEPGKMPFWRGDRPGRPAELGRRIGALARTIGSMPEDGAVGELTRDATLDARAAKNLVRYVIDQKQVTKEVPSDEVVVVERFIDELGDQRVCVLCPLGAKVLAPWAMAVSAHLKEDLGVDLDVIWSDDGIIFRVADVDKAPELSAYIPASDEVESLVMRSLDKTALFASRFRENAARALLLPRRSPAKRVPLWSQRKRAADLLSVASRYGEFPIVLETFRECLRDALDIPTLVEHLELIEAGKVRVVRAESRVPSPFASSLLFSYVSNFMYEGDAPLAERRAQALSLDQDRLRELLGEVELRELLDEDAIEETAAQVSHVRRTIAHADHLHDLLLSLGDMSDAEVDARAAQDVDTRPLAAMLVEAGRAIRIVIGGEARLVAVEDAARYRDALGVKLPKGLPPQLLARVPNALAGLLGRYARTHGPFTIDEIAQRFGLGADVARGALLALVGSGRLATGSFSPSREAEEFVDADVLRTIKRRSLARLRKAVEPVPSEAFARFLSSHHGIGRPSGGHDALLTTIERLEGLALPVTVWFEDVLVERVRDFAPSMLDDLCAAGEIVWRGVEPIGQSDARVSFHLADRTALLMPAPSEPTHTLAPRVLQVLESRGAVFFDDLASRVGAFPPDVLAALWDLVFAGLVTNDTTAPLRSLYLTPADAMPSRSHPRFRSRRKLVPGSEGRWSLLQIAPAPPPSDTDRGAAVVSVLLDRHGVLTRESMGAESIQGGFSTVYPFLRAMEDAGRLRRGYFVDGLGAAQFARPGVEEELRAFREPQSEHSVVRLSAVDPANPYGAVLPWPKQAGEGSDAARLARAAGAHVFLLEGRLVAYLTRGDQTLVTFLSREEPSRSSDARLLAKILAASVEHGDKRVLTLTRIDGDDAAKSPLAPIFRDSGFTASGGGLMARREGSFARR
ncbi:MAG: DEAD/DEAH box helicase [Polyangiaceae bacterium]|nr:DEAD/DEAH box helicase [Polyangiaceae bacterium]